MHIAYRPANHSNPLNRPLFVLFLHLIHSVNNATYIVSQLLKPLILLDLLFIMQLTWDCVHIPVKPWSLAAVDLLCCPSPFIVGIVTEQAPSPPLRLKDSTGDREKRCFSLAKEFCGMPESAIPTDVSILDLEGVPTLTESFGDMRTEGRENTRAECPTRLVEKLEVLAQKHLQQKGVCTGRRVSKLRYP